MAEKLILPSSNKIPPPGASLNVSTGYDYTIGPRQSLPNELNAPYVPSRIYSEPLVRPKKQVSYSAMAFMFQEMTSYIYSNSKTTSEFDQKLNDYGYGIGVKLLEVLNMRASFPAGAYSKSSSSILSTSSVKSSTTAKTEAAVNSAASKGVTSGPTPISEKSYDTIETISSQIANMRRRDLEIIDILQFVHGTLWLYLFGRPSNDLVKSSERENEYMIVDNNPVLTEFISGGVSCDNFLCGIINGFLTIAGFPCTVTPHSTAEDGFEDRVVYLIKFDKQVLEREELRYGSKTDHS